MYLDIFSAVSAGEPLPDPLFNLRNRDLRKSSRSEPNWGDHVCIATLRLNNKAASISILAYP